jgi:hypothetical protein
MAPIRRNKEGQKKRRVLQDTDAKFKVREKFLQSRHLEIVEAVKYCKEHNCSKIQIS